jgi:Invasion associated locus B (IalB) protein
MGTRFLAAVLTVVGAGGLSGALAQESDNRVAANTDWSVFVEEATENAPKTCWAVSAPKETVNMRDGAAVAVQRGDILLFATYTAGGPSGQISFAGGYTFAEGSNPTLDIGGQVFNLALFPEANPEMAWSASPDDDARIVEAMKAGSSAIVKAKSRRGTDTTDTFSLLGISAALDEAAKRCAG